MAVTIFVSHIIQLTCSFRPLFFHNYLFVFNICVCRIRARMYAVFPSLSQSLGYSTKIGVVEKTRNTHETDRVTLITVF